MKTKTSRLLLLCVLLSIVIEGCSQSGATDIQHLSLPMWKQSDWEAEKWGHERPIDYRKVTVTVAGKPPYYHGDVPFWYEMASPSRDPMLPNPPYGTPDKVLYFVIDNFKTMFIYNGTDLVGAQAVDATGRVVGEAKLRYYNDVNQKPAIEAEEVHYDYNGTAIFHCKSEIDFLNGNKTKESNISGKKDNEYFFVWPRF